jgi:hypothetical protein
MFFVLSAGRSGSRTIVRTLSQFRNAVCLHHPKPDLVLEATAYHYGSYPQDAIKQVLRASRKPFIGRKIYGEANLQLSLLIPVLREVFPHAKYVWLTRDGRDAVASMYYRGWYDDAAQTRIPAYWHQARLQGDRTGDFSEAAWAALSRFERCCWLWKKYNLIIEASLASTDRLLWQHVPLEYLKAALDELATFLGLKRGWRMLVERHNVALQPVTYWEAWASEQRAQFEHHCGAEMDRWYPQWRSANAAWQPLTKEEPDRPGALLSAERWLMWEVRRMQRRLKRATSR